MSPLATALRAIRALTIAPARIAASGFNRTAHAMGSLAARFHAAEQTEQALAALPGSTQRKLTVITVRCDAGKLLLRVLRVPTYLPGAAHDRRLVVPTSATTWRAGDQLMPASAWFLADHDESLTLRCRCHAEVGLTRGQLLGESPPPAGIHVLPVS
ncbi:MAG: hypothetical protein ACRDS1_09595 [Pseudonocardiaceae bacterium]